MASTVKAGIFTFYMKNLHPKTVDLHRQVVAKRNPQGYPHHHILTEMEHGFSMDMVWGYNGQPVVGLENLSKTQGFQKRWDYDVIMFLDVDAIPLSDDALEYYIKLASTGVLVGNIQRSNHIQNNQHVFAAPNAVAMSVDTFATIGFPSARPTRRGDVGEEYTFAAEKTGIVHVKLVMPLAFEEAPAECPYWPLADGMPVYGRGTTFGETFDFDPNTYLPAKIEKPLFWHQFQSFHPGQQEKYWKKCDDILNPKLTANTITANIA